MLFVFLEKSVWEKEKENEDKDDEDERRTYKPRR